MLVNCQKSMKDQLKTGVSNWQSTGQMGHTHRPRTLRLRKGKKILRYVTKHHNTSRDEIKFDTRALRPDIQIRKPEAS